MARFNTAVAPPQPDTINRAGGEAFMQSPELAFVSLLLTSMVKDQFYRSADEQIAEVERLVDQIADKEFVAKAAVYARNEFGMRSISHIAAATLADRVKGPTKGKAARAGYGPWLTRFFERVVRRPDDITETIAFYLSRYGSPRKRRGGEIPNAMRKGFAKALEGFDKYQMAKYAQIGKAVSLIDAVNICHPKRTDATEALILDGLSTNDVKLESAATWDRALSGSGDGALTAEEKEQAWADVVRSGKIGYFAALRNIRNILQDAPEVLDDLCSILVEERRIRKALVLPFRYVTAIKAVQEMGRDMAAQKVYAALNAAIHLSLDNVPKFDGKTLVALDRSGSMSMRRGQGGETANEIGALFAAVLAKRNVADVLTFGTGYEYERYNIADSTLTIAQHFARHTANEGTNFHLVFEHARDRYDRIIILSDMQAWVRHYYNTSLPTEDLKAYRRKYGVDTRVYAFDLAGQGDMQFPETGVFALAGFSDKVFDIMGALEQDRDALVNKIKAVEL